MLLMYYIGSKLWETLTLSADNLEKLAVTTINPFIKPAVNHSKGKDCEYIISDRQASAHNTIHKHLLQIDIVDMILGNFLGKFSQSNSCRFPFNTTRLKTI